MKKANKIIANSSVAITNNPNILQWLVDCQLKSYKNGQKNLSSNLLIELNSLFGSHNKGFRLEFMTKLWILEHDGLEFNVFTAKGKGTSIEICGFNCDDIRNGIKYTEIITFLEKLHELINSTEL